LSLTISKNIKGLKERLFVMTQTPDLQIFGEIHFIKLQNDTTLKQLKTKKNEMRFFIYFFPVFV